MVFKQLLINLYEYWSEKYFVGKKLRAVDELFAAKIAQADLEEEDVYCADLKMHCEIEKQLAMKPATQSLVGYYNEGVIQLGFIAFFATAFPFAPLFSFLTNLLEIKIKLQHISIFGRRNVAEGTSGIGNWSPIMSFVSYFAIPANVVILLYCRFPTVTVGASQKHSTLPIEEEGLLVQFLYNRDPAFWDRTTIIVFAIMVEHAVIALKIVIALIIPDVPHKVQQDEVRREKIIEKAQTELLRIKIDGNHESFNDMTARLQREAAKVMDD